MRIGLLLALAAAVAAPAGPPPGRPMGPARAEFVQAVEFPYYLYPQALWERELVWLKNIGVRTVEFSIPWNWHQLQPGDFDFTGRTSPRRDLIGFIRLLRRLGLHAWVRPLPPVDDWLGGGEPEDHGQPRAWLAQLEKLLATQTASHGGPVEFVEGRGLAIDAAAPPEPVTVLSAIDPAALARSRAALAAAHGALLWKDVEDTLHPAGWEPGAGSLLRHGAVGLSGDEHPSVAALRRSAALLRNWAALFGSLRPVAMPKPPSGKLPAGVSTVELVSPAVSAVSITNRSAREFHDDLRVFEPATRRTTVIPNVTVPAGESLWIPVNASLATDGLCRDCSNFSAAERLVYATAELLFMDYENGILAMEFAAPVAGEAILQLEHKPIGPFLAAGKPMDFDWDNTTFRARLPIPASDSADHRVRIGIAIDEPENSAFFNELRRLIVGQKNAVNTSYSSAQVAARSRLRLPEGFSATAVPKSSTEIDYEIAVPADAVHGDFADLALEADGVPQGRARPQLFRPLSIRLLTGVQIHFGSRTEITPDPPIADIAPRAGTELELALRNNWPAIQTYRLEASGDGLEFYPAKSEISIGAMDERRVTLRVFEDAGADTEAAGLRTWRLRVTGAGTAPIELPIAVVLLPRGRTVAWSADLDGDGSPEWVLESQKVRAVFSAQDGGRWRELTAKDTNTNFLPEQGAFAVPGPVSVRLNGDALEFSAAGWTRTARLSGQSLTIEQTTPLPADGLVETKQGNITLAIERPSPTRAIYTLE